MSHRVTYSNPASLLEADLAALRSAQHSIDFAAYSLTHPSIIAALAERCTAGVALRLYLDRGELEAAARGHNNPALLPIAPLLSLPGATVRVKASKILMHLKAFSVDQRIVRDGAGNFSPNGLTEEDNSSTFDDDADALAAFHTKFESMWARPDNMSVNVAIQTSPSEPHQHMHQR